ncbi:SDR family NAD(P)-dependent oxidoreductase [Nocardioides mangrovi]|uniref:SDR family oxidoreductase n=1 Tax=Nocardioides mangrovi TaxID=2874580 RepID=A0ABS7UC22_9ACTN|nr:SDR family oxidoreductase [Nocardioides mangrovi]MBZ5738427.1 SDR family oxidoreductase [Nocardioides mangrovi]
MVDRPKVARYDEAAVLIAGGTSGVGLASARAFLDAGVRRLALLARTEERGVAVRDDLRRQAPEAQVEFLRCDAAQHEQVEHIVHEAHRLLGGLDVVVSSTTATYRPELLSRIPYDDVAGIMLGQALPPMLLTRAAMPLLADQGGGSIITIASDAAKVATPGESVLGAAMAAIVMFTRVAAIEGKRDGVRCNVLTPSLIAGTPTAENVLRDGFSKKLFERAAAQAHLGVAEPEDQASLVVFLGGPSAAKLTGQAISVNGGISAA